MVSHGALTAQQQIRCQRCSTNSSSALDAVDQQKTIFCLDFDGVICNSANETGTAGWKCCEKLWPDISWAKMPKSGVLSDFCEVRPCLESGWESVLLVRMLATGQADVPTLLNSFQSGLKEQEMAKLGLTQDGLVEEFNAMRKSWIAEDEEGW